MDRLTCPDTVVMLLWMISKRVRLYDAQQGRNFLPSGNYPARCILDQTVVPNAAALPPGERWAYGCPLWLVGVLPERHTHPPAELSLSAALGRSEGAGEEGG